MLATGVTKYLSFSQLLYVDQGCQSSSFIIESLFSVVLRLKTFILKICCSTQRNCTEFEFTCMSTELISICATLMLKVLRKKKKKVKNMRSKVISKLHQEPGVLIAIMLLRTNICCHTTLTEMPYNESFN